MTKFCREMISLPDGLSAGMSHLPLIYFLFEMICQRASPKDAHSAECLLMEMVTLFAVAPLRPRSNASSPSSRSPVTSHHTSDNASVFVRCSCPMGRLMPVSPVGGLGALGFGS